MTTAQTAAAYGLNLALTAARNGGPSNPSRAQTIAGTMLARIDAVQRTTPESDICTHIELRSLAAQIRGHAACGDVGMLGANGIGHRFDMALSDAAARHYRSEAGPVKVRKAAPAQRPVIMATVDAPRFVDRTPCRVCGTRADIGCKHNPSAVAA